MKPRAMYAMGCVTLLLAGAGCAHGENAADRQIAELRDEVAKVQVERDRYERRVNQLELSAAEQRQDANAAGALPAATPGVSTPNLRVVHLAPGGVDSPEGTAAGAGDEPDGDDGTPRPTIRIVGNGAENRGAKRRNGAPGVVDDAADTQGRTSAADPEARRAYDNAFALIQAKEYDKALEAFAAFLVKWPDHPNADAATYWRGEAYFAKSDFTRAAEQFEGVVVGFSTGNKVPDALLKLGICQLKLGNPQKAKSYFDKLAREYPRTDAARRIPQGGSVQVRPEEKR